MAILPLPATDRPYLTLPGGWNAGYLAAKANIATTPLRVLWGPADSISAGTSPATDVKTTIAPSKLRDTWLAKYPTANLHAAYWHNSGPSYGYPGGPFGAALNGHVFGSIGNGWLGADRLHWPSATPINDWGQRFTGTRASTALDLLWYQNFPGTWKFNVDRGAAGTSFTYDLGSGSQGGTTGTDVTVTSTGSGTTADNANDKMLRITVDGLPSGVHTIDVGKMSAQYYVGGFDGVTEYPTGRTGGGLSFANIAVSGHKASYWDQFDFTVTPRDQALVIGQGVSPQTYNGTGGGTFGFPTGSHLMILCIGVNDLIDKTPDQFSNGMERMIRAARRATPGCSVVLVVQPMPSPVYGDVNTGVSFATNWKTWDQFVGRMYALANAHGCAVVNLHAKWGETPAAQGFMTDNIHWLDAGHADLAALLLSIL